MKNTRYSVYIKIFRILYLCGLRTMFPDQTIHIVQLHLYFHYCLFYIHKQYRHLLTIVLRIVYNVEREKINHFIMNKTITNKTVWHACV